MSAIPFEPRRFRSTAAYYTRFRVPYPEALIDDVARRVGLEPGDRVLDLGCGPGMLAIAFARRGMSVLGLDPEDEMLEAARADAASAGVDVTFRQGSSYDLPAETGAFKLVVIGRAFHWMDREKTLEMLDGLLVADGAIALFDDHAVKRTPDWKPLLDRLSQAFVPDNAVLRKIRHEGGFQRHETVLLHSAFSDVSLIGRPVIRDLTADEVVGFALSLSVTSPQALGDRRDAFETDLRAGLAELSPEGRFHELVRPEALVAFRPK
jgi:SAM-dependent methyltransferase